MLAMSWIFNPLPELMPTSATSAFFRRSLLGLAHCTTPGQKGAAGKFVSGEKRVSRREFLPYVPNSDPAVAKKICSSRFRRRAITASGVRFLQASKLLFFRAGLSFVARLFARSRVG